MTQLWASSNTKNVRFSANWECQNVWIMYLTVRYHHLTACFELFKSAFTELALRYANTFVADQTLCLFSRCSPLELVMTSTRLWTLVTRVTIWTLRREMEWLLIWPIILTDFWVGNPFFKQEQLFTAFHRNNSAKRVLTKLLCQNSFTNWVHQMRVSALVWLISRLHSCYGYGLM